MKKKAALIIAAALSISTIFAGCGNTTQAEPVTETPAVTATTTQPAAEEKAPDKTDELARMFVKGIHNRFVLQDSKDINYLRDTEYAEKIVEDVKVDDSEVDTTKAGKYTVHYTVTVNKKNLEKAQKYLDEHPEVAAAAEKAEKPEGKTKPAEGTADTTKPAEKDADKTADAAVTPGTEAGTEEDGQNVETPAESPAEDAQAVEETTDDSTKEDENAEGEAQTDEEGDKTDAETPAETPTDAQDENTASDDKPADAPAEGQTPAETPAEQPTVIEKEPEVVIPDIPESVFEDDKDDTTPDETVEIVIDKTVEIVTPEEAVEIIDQGGEVWTDNSEPVKKEDLVSPTEETVEKPEEKKEEEKVEEKTETTNTEPEQNDDSHQESHNDDGDDYEEPSHSSGGSAQSEPKHEHHWVKKTRTVHHEDGHYETKQTGTETVTDNDAWDEPVYESVCRCTACGAEFSDEDDAAYHVVAEHNNEASWSVRDVQVDTIHHPAETHEEPVYEEQWVDDSWDEEVSDGYYCDECGATK